MKNSEYFFFRMLGQQTLDTTVDTIISKEEDKYLCLEAEQHIVAGALNNIIR